MSVLNIAVTSAFIGYVIGGMRRHQQYERIISSAFPEEWAAAKQRRAASLSSRWVLHPWDHRDDHPVWYTASAVLVAIAGGVLFNVVVGLSR